MEISVDVIVVPPLYSNCYIVADENGECVVVDPGGEVDEITKLLEERGLNLKMILNTHGHIDHIGGNAELRRRTGAKIGIHPIDAPMLGSTILCGAEWTGVPFEEHKEDFLFEDGDVITVGGMNFRVLFTPGHSPGSCCLYLEDKKVLFAGDLVFMDAVGRWDLPGGNKETLFTSLKEKFLTLPDDVTVFSGHGAVTTVERERRHNPFLA